MLVFFGSIGLGFMFVEISQMQRLIILLGHPTYSLSVVLFSLLVSSGVGSYLTRAVPVGGAVGPPARMLLVLLAVLVVFGFVSPDIVRSYEGAVTWARILLVVGMLAPVGLFMGMAFPLCMRLASGRAQALIPWLWGIKGPPRYALPCRRGHRALCQHLGRVLTGAGCYAVALSPSYGRRHATREPAGE